MGLSPSDAAKLALKYLADELTDEEKKILKTLIRTGSIRSASWKLFGTLHKRYVIRRLLKKCLREVYEKLSK